MILKSIKSNNPAPVSITRKPHKDFNSSRAGVDEPRASNVVDLYGLSSQTNSSNS